MNPVRTAIVLGVCGLMGATAFWCFQTARDIRRSDADWQDLGKTVDAGRREVAVAGAAASDSAAAADRAKKTAERVKQEYDGLTGAANAGIEVLKHQQEAVERRREAEDTLARARQEMKLAEMKENTGGTCPR